MMMNNRRSALGVMAAVAALFSAGCAPLLVGGAVAGGAMVATDRRSTGAQQYQAYAVRSRNLRELCSQAVQRGVVAKLGAALHRQIAVRKGLAQLRHLAGCAVLCDALAKQLRHQHRRVGQQRALNAGGLQLLLCLCLAHGQRIDRAQPGQHLVAQRWRGRAQLCAAHAGAEHMTQ